jgi:CelD/BcsL family acetyltransferase involved in cellulose biosynthesis
MLVKQLSSFEEIGRDRWQELLARSPGSTVFQDYDWLRSWWLSCREEGDELAVMAAFAGERLVGVAPLCVRTARGEAVFVGDSHSDYQLFPHDTAHDGVLERLVDEIYRWSAGRWRVLLREIPETDQLAALLLERSQRPFERCVAQERTACPRVDIAGEPGVIDRLLRKSSLKRHAAALRKLGNVAVSHITDAAEASRHLDAFFEQHVRRWSVTPFPSLFLRQRNRRFYRELVEQSMLGGKAILTAVELNGRPVAYHFGLVSGTEFVWYKPSFDITLWKESPGETLLMELLAKARDDGRTVFDFTRGDEGFKSRFANVVRFNRSFVVEKSPATGIGSRSLVKLRAAWRRARSLPVIDRLLARGAAGKERSAPRLLGVSTVAGLDLVAPNLAPQRGEWRLEEATLPDLLASFDQGTVPAAQRARLVDWFPRLRKQQRCWLVYDGPSRAIGCVWRAAVSMLDDPLLVAALERARVTECAHGLELWDEPRSPIPALLTAVRAATGATLLASRAGDFGVGAAVAWRLRRIELLGRVYDLLRHT